MYIRLIGRNYDDVVAQNDIKSWPFEVINKNKKPYIKVNFKRETRFFSPEEILAMILTKLKRDAETFLWEPVTLAIVTVPAYFEDSQRQVLWNIVYTLLEYVNSQNIITGIEKCRNYCRD